MASFGSSSSRFPPGSDSPPNDFWGPDESVGHKNSKSSSNGQPGASEFDQGYTEETQNTFKPNKPEFGDLLEKTLKSLLLPPKSIKLPSFPEFNRITGGFRSREFTILCGATGKGKTTVCANISYDLVLQKQKHFVMSVETGPEDFMRRVLCCAADEDWNTGDPITIDKVDKVFRENPHLETMGEYLMISGWEDRLNIDTLKKELDHHVELGCKIAIIDNLNFFMEVTSAANQIIEMDRVIHDLIIYCKKTDIHIIMIMHPRKTDGGRVESEFDIKGSSTAVQEAHNVLLLNPVDQKYIDARVAEPGDREIKIAKMRRKGMYVGRNYIIRTKNGVKYTEVGAFK